MAYTGQWGIGGFRLPDYGWSESLGVFKNPNVPARTSTFSSVKPTPVPTPSASQNLTVTRPVSNTNPYAQYVPQATVNLPTTTTPRGSVLGTNTQLTPPDFSGVDQRVNDYGNLIEQDYRNAINSISAQEGLLRGQAQTAEGQIATEFADISTQLGNEQATRTGSVNDSLALAETQNKSSVQQARDLFNQIQQRNIAQLSAAGISSSSVNEALAERLGMETSRRFANLNDAITTVRTNATKELGRIKTYFEEKKTNLEREKSNRLSDIRNSLMSGLVRLNSARDQAETAKARARLDLITSAQREIAQIQANYEEVKQSLERWAVQKTQALTPIAQGDYNDILNAQIANLQSQYDPTQYDILPSYTYDRYGRPSARINVSPKRRTEEDLNTYDPEDPSYWAQ